MDGFLTAWLICSNLMSTQCVYETLDLTEGIAKPEMANIIWRPWLRLGPSSGVSTRVITRQEVLRKIHKLTEPRILHLARLKRDDHWRKVRPHVTS